MSDVGPGALVDGVARALQPRSALERVRTALVGGWTAAQVAERVDSDAVDAFWSSLADDVPPGQRRLVDRVREVLLYLERQGAVVRRASSYGASLAGKGQRKVVVDLFRLA